AIEAGDPRAAAELLPLVYDELRKLAAARLADEKPGQTLQPTALVHEASSDWSVATSRRTGPAGATSSPPPPRPCAASWSKPPGGDAASSGAATAGGSAWTEARPPRTGPTHSSRWATPRTGWSARTRSRRRWAR